MRTTYTDEQKTEALRLVATVGLSEAVRRLGLPMGTVAAWAHRNGVSSPPVESIAKAVEASKLSVAQRKADLADRMLGEAERILGQLHEPIVERVVKVVSRGSNQGSDVEIVDVDYDTPPTGDQKRIVDTVAVLVGQVQLLTGEATARTETSMSVTDARQRALAAVTELRGRIAS